jgi:hypothetical protein
MTPQLDAQYLESGSEVLLLAQYGATRWWWIKVRLMTYGVFLNCLYMMVTVVLWATVVSGWYIAAAAVLSVLSLHTIAYITARSV